MSTAHPPRRLSLPIFWKLTMPFCSARWKPLGGVNVTASNVVCAVAPRASMVAATLARMKTLMGTLM